MYIGLPVFCDCDNPKVQARVRHYNYEDLGVWLECDCGAEYHLFDDFDYIIGNENGSTIDVAYFIEKENHNDN